MIRVVVVEPEGDENLGMIARSMGNTGNKYLCLVNPRCDHLSAGARKYAIHSAAILENAEIFPSLKAALSQCRLSIAVTRRSGDKRRLDLDSRSLFSRLESHLDQEICLVFGREQTGLTNKEIQACDLTCSIPSHPDQPSLNLAQAVMVILYELYRSQNTSRTDSASQSDFQEMMDAILHCLESIQYFKKTTPDGLMHVLGRVFQRADLQTKDAVVIRNLFQRLEGHFHRIRPQ